MTGDEDETGQATGTAKGRDQGTDKARDKGNATADDDGMAGGTAPACGLTFSYVKYRVARCRVVSASLG